jgi:hypothetical protein
MRAAATVLVLAVAIGFGCVAPLRAEVTAEQVRHAIDEAVSYLRKQQHDDGSWNELLPVQGGVPALCTLTLLTAGVPVSDPAMQAALAHLRKVDSKMTYVVALQTMVFCLAEPERDLLLIRRNVAYLESIQKRGDGAMGCWGYSGTQGRGDNSNAQFALLALHEAERIGVSTNEQTWRLARDYWQRTQNPDGSWGYYGGERGTGSMTCAGIAAMIMAADKLDRGDARVQGDRVECCGNQGTNDAVERGLKWLEQHFSVSSNPGDGGGHLLYYLYGMERVGRLTNRRLIGKHDWYREGAEVLVRAQAQLRGFWKGLGSGEQDPTIGTCLALLFLAKGRRPVLAAKLAFEPDDGWNRHRQDLANLTHYCERKWKRELTWQVMPLARATADDLNQAPVLYLSGSRRPQFSDDDVKAIREYLDLGGFLFAESCCGSTEFDDGFRALMEKLFPERDERGQLLHGLRLLPPDHSVWTAEEPVDPKYVRPLYGIDVGCRTSVIYCPDNLGCYWDLDRIGRKQRYPAAVEDEIRAVRAIGINVMAYATNREVKFKLEIPHIVRDDGKRDALERAKLVVAEVKHGGGSGVAPAALVNLMKQLAAETGLRVSAEKRELALTQEALFDQHLVFMHGRQAFTLSEAERRQLRTFVERGGLVFADAVCSSEEFASSFRREMAAIFPETSLRPISGKHAMFGTTFGGFDLSTVALRDPRRNGAAGPLRTDVLQIPPELEGVQIGERYGVIFSKYDLSCALERQNSLECAGYARDDAAKIGINVVLFSLRGNL